MSAEVDILLVHGAWADASSWLGVIEELQRRDITTAAVQLRERTLSDDVAIVTHAISRSTRPVVAVGHSYGGAVISGATHGADNVRALVFVAAYAPDEGETILALNERFAATPIVEALRFDDQGDATVDPESFPTVFMPDVPQLRARALAVVQHPISGAAFQEPAGAPGWRTLPCYYQVSADDRVINPDLIWRAWCQVWVVDFSH